MCEDVMDYINLEVCNLITKNIYLINMIILLPSGVKIVKNVTVDDISR